MTNASEVKEKILMEKKQQWPKKKLETSSYSYCPLTPEGAIAKSTRICKQAFSTPILSTSSKMVEIER